MLRCCLAILRRRLDRAQEPLVALTGNPGQYVFSGLEFLLRLFLLEAVDVQPFFFNIQDDRVPSKRCADTVAHTRQEACSEL